MDSLEQKPPGMDHSFFPGQIRVDPAALRVERDGSSHRIEPKAMEVLLVLAREPGQVVSRQSLEQEIWPGRIVTDYAVTSTVIKLRKALHDNPRKPLTVGPTMRRKPCRRRSILPGKRH